ncbi:MAG: rod shape-determining protein MreC [Bradymonadia bacterium]
MTPLGDGGRTRFNWRALGIVLSASIVLCFLSTKSAPNRLINTLPSILVAPLTSVASTLGQEFRGLQTLYLSNTEAAAELNRVQNEVVQLKRQVVEMQSLKRQIRLLRKQLEFSEARKDLDLIPAKIVSRTNSGFSRRVQIKIEQSNHAAIKLGAPVVASNTLIGQVISLDDQHAELMLLSDPRSAVDIRLSESKTRGVAVGAGRKNTYDLGLKYLSQDDSIKIGAHAITTGLDGKFPADLIVGTVVKAPLEHGEKSTQVIISSSVDLESLQYVFVIAGKSGLSADGKSYQEAQ